MGRRLSFDLRLTLERNLSIYPDMLRALLWVGFWISYMHNPKTKFYEPTSAEVVRALKLAQVQAKA